MISQLIAGDNIPEFDNLYLDMNSILHTCTHLDDDTLHRMTEDQMYLAIFNYIDHLFDIIKPKEVFYMAIDGVAPRAKMNQQRARRFRTAYEAEQNLRKAVSQGAEIPKEDPFDSNAITPGTEFMAKLTQNLKYFIHKKMSEDPRWANIKIVLSGHEVPGEGEHKIMQFIRAMKSQPDYNANMRHCIYGLDADLIVLGLVTHDPHFSLLREEVTFGPRSKKKSGDVHDQKFFLLHLSLLREYMGLEFQDLDGQLPFAYDFERILDDFILIMYVIGNDFLPHLPDLHINKGAFPLLIGAFKQSIRHMDGYLNEGGKINFQRLSVWLDYLSEFELENFEKDSVDVDWFNKRLEDISITGEKKRERTGKSLILKEEKELVLVLKKWLLTIATKPIAELTQLANEDNLPVFSVPAELAKKNLDFLKKLAMETGFLLVHSRSNDTYEAIVDVDGISPYETDEEYQSRVLEICETVKKYESSNTVATDELMKEAKDLYNKKFIESKDKYYKEKLHFSIHDDNEMIALTRHYCEGLQWVLYYYYKGCPSWNWYYKYHYSPRISDINKGIHDMIAKNEAEVKFDLAKPFKPFEQLMAVLPARSRKLIPDVYRPLMTDERSPIIDFYPEEVDVDLNGKTASWEAVVLLSFVDEKRLLEVLKPIEAKLTPEETKRNSYGRDIVFIYNPQNDSLYPTPLPGFYHDLEHDKCYEETLALPSIDPNFKFELPEGAKLGKDLLAGFPTLYTLPFTSKLSLLEVKVFNQPSRSESMILTLGNHWGKFSVNQFINKFLGKIVYSKWPFLSESKVVSVWDAEYKHEFYKQGNEKKVNSQPLSPNELIEFRTNTKSLSAEYAKTQGVIVGPIEAVVFVQRVTGLVRTQRGAYAKTFAEQLEPFPLQLIVDTVKNEDQRYATRGPIPIDQEFPKDLPVVFLGAFAYGAPAVVAGHTEPDKLNIRIDKILSALEPNIGKKRLEIERREIRYLPSFEVAKVLKISTYFLSKITGSFMLKDGGSKINIGLDVKFDGRRIKVLGYSRKSSKFWEFSPLTIQLIKEYRAKFPKFFNTLQNLPNMNDMPKVSEVTNPAELKAISQWLKAAKADMQQVSLESESLTKFSIAAIENFMDDFISKPLPLDKKDVKGVPMQAVINPSVSSELLRAQRFDLGDRVIYVQESGKVPKLSKGTVVGITAEGRKTSLAVVFDVPLVGGNNMGGKLRTNRGTVVDSSLVLNITNRQLVYHSKASKNKKPVNNSERQVKAKVPEAPKSKNNVAPQSVVKEEGAKKTNEILALLKKGKGKQEDEPSVIKDKKSENEGAEASEGTQDPAAVKQIYGQIYNNVMSQGHVAVGVPPSGPFPPIGGPVLMRPHEFPVVPGIPLPPQFIQQQPMHAPFVPPSTAPVEPLVNEASRPESNGDGLSRGGRGRGSGRGSRGGRGGRGGRGLFRGRGRGQGAKPSE